MNDETTKEFAPEEMVTQPLKEHEWLNNLVGEWKIESEMNMPDGSQLKSTGSASVKNLGGLWAFADTKDVMPDGTEMIGHFALGYDVTFKEYRACMIMSASSHLWKYTGELSDDEKTMTLMCEGPNMMGEGTAMYRDVIELVDDTTRTTSSYGQDDKGEWMLFAKTTYTRV